MTMEGLEGFFEHVGQLNPQCIAEELPAPPSSKSPSLTAEKQFSGELQTPSYKPPPPLPPVIDKTESTSSSKKTMEKIRMRILQKIRKTSYEAKADEHRERIIPIKLLHTPSKMSLGMEHSQSFENRRSFFESTSQQHSTEYDAMKTGAGNGSVMKRYTYDPSSMSHKEFLLKGPSKTETAGGDGIDLIKDTPNTPTTPSPTGGTSLSRPQRVTETVINDVPIENLVNSGGYTHIKSSPPPDYTPEPSTQRTPLATLAGADQRDTRQLTASTADIDAGASTTTFARSSLHRKLEKRSSSRDAIGITPLTEPSPALSAQSDWTYHNADDVNIRSSESNMQSVDQSSGHLSPAKQHQQQNDFIITPEMKRSRSPIVVRVTMGRKDRNITRIGEEQQSDTMTGSKKPIETNIDDVTSPEYNSTWTGLNRMSQSSLNDKQNIASSYNTDVVSGFATHYAYSGSAAAIATGSAPGAGDSPQGGSLQQTQSLRAMNAKNWASNCGGEQTTTTTSTTLAATGGNVVRSALQQNRSTYGINGTIAATNTRNSGYGYSSDETTNTITNTTITQEGAVPTGQQSNQSIYGGQSLTAQRSKSYGYGDEEIATTAKTAVTEGSMGDVTTNRYRKNPNFNTSSQAIVSQRGQGYGYDGEQMTTTTTKTTVTTADGVSQQQRGSYGMQLNSTNKRYSKGIDYDEDEITTTMKNVVTAENNGIDAQPNRGSSVFLARKGAGYGYGDEEYTTTTKTITTSEAVSGAPHVPLHQTQNVYGVKKGAADYGYEDEETTVTKTTTTGMIS
ncbi:unnamed protein product [Toxocara canis]|uniref:Mucin-5AC n=1 Tax=Toxocara canis TaxID=6265 RepID=A0A183USJ7_TOXCA|nr:unnamed protein product [Toxocara canis]